MSDEFSAMLDNSRIDLPVLDEEMNDLKLKTLDDSASNNVNICSLQGGTVGEHNLIGFSNATAEKVTKPKEKRFRHRQLSLQNKLELLADVDNKIGSKKEIAAKYGIPSNTLSTIVKYRHRVETAAKITFFQPGRKRMRESNFSGIDRQLFAWVKQAQFRNEPVNGITLAERADYLADELGVDSFKASSGWIDRFKKRHGIVFTKLKSQKNNGQSSSSGGHTNKSLSSALGLGACANDENGVSSGRVTNNFENGEDLGLVISSIFKPPPVDKNAAKSWSKDALPYVLDEYQPEDIFCVDETDIFFKCLPDKLQSANKGKGSKDKVTVLLSVNMTGMEKLPLLVIGKLALSSSSSVKTLPLEYIVDKTCGMTHALFESWLNEVDEKFLEDSRKIALIVNSSPAHSSIVSTSLKAVKVIFLSGNTTGLLQPCSQGITHSFKMHYRTRLVQKYILHARNEINRGNFHCADSFHISISNALFCMRAAWDQVEKNTIVNSFRHAGFHARQNHPVIEEAAQSHLNHLLERLGQLVPVETTVNAFVDIDKDLKTSHRDFLVEVMEGKGSKKDNSAQKPPESVTASAAMKAVETLKKFAQERDLGEDMFDAISSVEFIVEAAAVEDNDMNFKEEVESDDSGDDDDTEEDDDVDEEIN